MRSPTSCKEELTEATERFQAALQDNLRALRAMRDVNERVMRAVVEALEEPRARSPATTSAARCGAAGASRSIGPVAIQQRA